MLYHFALEPGLRRSEQSPSLDMRGHLRAECQCGLAAELQIASLEGDFGVFKLELNQSIVQDANLS